VESTAILTEVLPRHARDTELHTRARNGIRSLLESPDTQLVDVSTVVARKAGDLRAEHGLKTWDAIHLATAVLARVDVLIVRDSHFPFGDYEGVHISRPFDIDDDKLHLSRLLRCTGQPALARLSSARPSPCRNEAQRAFLTQQRAQLEDID
jgi:predicted nucleic acid-binding protein